MPSTQCWAGVGWCSLNSRLHSQGSIKFKLHYDKLSAHFMNNLAYFMNNSIFKRLVPDQANTMYTHDLMHLGSKMIQETPSLCLPQQNRRKSWPWFLKKQGWCIALKWFQWNGVVFVIFKSLRHLSKSISEGNTHGTKGVDFWSGVHWQQWGWWRHLKATGQNSSL